MSWLGASGFSRDAMQSLGAAYASMGQTQQPEETQEEAFEKWLNVQLEGGADLSEFTTDEVYDYYVNEVLEEEKKSGKKGRCWTGYKPTPGKEPYSPGSCQKEEAIEEGKDPCQQALETDKKVGELQKKVDKDVERAREGKKFKEENELLASLADAYNMMYEKKKDSDKCGDDTYWDKEEKKCKSKKKSSSGRRSTVIVGHGYPGYGGGGGSNDNDGDGGDTDGGEGGGDGGGGGE